MTKRQLDGQKPFSREEISQPRIDSACAPRDPVTATGPTTGGQETKQIPRRIRLCGECVLYLTPWCEYVYLGRDLVLFTDMAVCRKFYPLKDRVKRFMRDRRRMIAWLKAKKEGVADLKLWSELSHGTQ